MLSDDDKKNQINQSALTPFALYFVWFRPKFEVSISSFV